MLGGLLTNDVQSPEDVSQGKGNEMAVQIVVLCVFLILLFQVISLLRYLRLYLRARRNSVPIDFSTMMMLPLQKVNPALVVNASILAKNAGLEIPVADMATLVLAGGNLERVVQAMATARSANLDLPWEKAIEIDLSGSDVLLLTHARIAEAGAQQPGENEPVSL